jgi:multidrug resistance efflux pump
MTKTLFLFLGIISLIVLPIGWSLVPHFSSMEKSLSAAQEIEELGSEADRKIVVCYGYADLEGGVTSLQPSQLGRVAEVLVKENDTVAAGAILLRLDDSAARFRVAEAKALMDKALAEQTEAKKAPEQHRCKIAQQQAAIKVARARIAGARHLLAARKVQQITDRIAGRYRDDPVLVEEIASSAERVKELQETGKVEQESLNILEARDPTAEVERARAEVATMRARLLQAEQVLEEHVLRAPQAGRVERVFVTPGEWLSPQAKKTAIQFCPNRPRIIRAEVEQVFALRVAVSQSALVEDDGRSGKTWRGHVMRIADWYTQRRLVAEEQLQFKDVRTLECLIALDPGQAPLRIGQRVRVTIREAGRSRKEDD